MKNLLLALALLLPASAWAQDIILWKTHNLNSPTIVPPYAGEPTPFPLNDTEDPAAETSLDPLAEAARLARLAALEKAEKLLASKQAFYPDTSPLVIGGRVENAAGDSKVLITNQWIGVGRRLKLRLIPTRDVIDAINDLRKYDVDAANELEINMNLRLQERPFADINIARITPQNMELSSEYGTILVPIPRQP